MGDSLNTGADEVLSIPLGSHRGLRMVKSSKGARVASETGELFWKPAESRAPRPLLLIEAPNTETVVSIIDTVTNTINESQGVLYPVVVQENDLNYKTMTEYVRISKGGVLPSGAFLIFLVLDEHDVENMQEMADNGALVIAIASPSDGFPRDAFNVLRKAAGEILTIRPAR